LERASGATGRGIRAAACLSCPAELRRPSRSVSS